MERDVFQRLCAIALDEAGIQLCEGKEALVAARVGRRLRALGLTDPRAYLRYLEQHRADELVPFLDAISTNYTRFFREGEHFVELARWIQGGRLVEGAEFRLWCAAAATGEEPYSLAITLREALGAHGAGFRILATDISTAALNKALGGRYPLRAIEPLSPAQRAEYLEREAPAGEADQLYRVKPFLRDQIVYRRLNLATPPFPMKGPFDAVFCRNVIIYLSAQVRQRLLGEIERLLRPGGLLFTGHSESLAGFTTGLRMVRPSIYRKPVTQGTARAVP